MLYNAGILDVQRISEAINLSSHLIYVVPSVTSLASVQLILNNLSDRKLTISQPVSFIDIHLWLLENCPKEQAPNPDTFPINTGITFWRNHEEQI